jgi:predicted nuclease with TOPRIM domain
MDDETEARLDRVEKRQSQMLAAVDRRVTEIEGLKGRLETLADLLTQSNAPSKRPGQP